MRYVCLIFFPSLVVFSDMVDTACERCEMIHDFSWWHIVSVLIQSVFILAWRYMVFAAGGRCEWYMIIVMVRYHFSIDQIVSPLPPPISHVWVRIWCQHCIWWYLASTAWAACAIVLPSCTEYLRNSPKFRSGWRLMIVHCWFRIFAYTPEIW